MHLLLALNNFKNNPIRKHFSKCLIAILFLFNSFNAGANDDYDGLTYRQWKKKVMKEQILILKNGALLIRLKTKLNSVNALREHGDSAKANLILENQIELNKSIVEAFTNNYSFCPVYYFFSDYSDTVRNHNLNEVAFLNAELIHDPNIKPTATNFLTCEFGNVRQDTAYYLSGTYLRYTDDGLKRSESYYGSVETYTRAITMMSDQFIQLWDPFPYYVKIGNPNPNQNKLNKAVKKLNLTLIHYFNKCNK